MKTTRRPARKYTNPFPRRCADGLHCVNDSPDQSQVKTLIGQCQFLIGSRMHACIAALSQRVPAVGLAYSPKFKGVFDSIGMGDMALDARALPPDALIKGCLSRFHAREALSQHLARHVPEIQGAVNASFDEMLKVDAAMEKTFAYGAMQASNRALR